MRCAWARRRWGGIGLTVALLTMVGCATSDDPVVEGSPDATAEVAVLDVTAVDDGNGGGYGFSVPGSVPGGPTRISLNNQGAEPHHAQLYKLDEGRTMDDLGAQLATGNPLAIAEVGSLDGGTGTTDPRTVSKADGLIDLTEGTYVFMCFIENAEGPHVAQGMIQPFEVTSDEEQGSLPEADSTATLADFAFGLASPLAADAVVELRNESQTELHEMNILKVQADTTTEDVVDFFAAQDPPAGPPPFSGVGGMQAIPPGESRKLQMDLEEGSYMVACFIPSQDGVPHIAKGMIQPLTIE